MAYFQTQMIEEERAILDKYPNIEYYRASGVGYLMKNHQVTTKELSSIRGQLSILTPEFDPCDFNSFLVEFEDGVVSECYGCVGTIIWPDSYLFKII